MASFERTEARLARGWIAVAATQGKTEPFDTFWQAPNGAPEPNRDDFRVDVVEHFVIFAVADGVSSQPRADEGSTRAAETAIAELAELCRSGSRFDENDLGTVMSKVHDALKRLAGDKGVDRRLFSTTLTIGVLDTSQGALICASVGDSFVVAGDGSSQSWRFPEGMMMQPQGGVHTITDGSFKKVINFGRAPFQVDTVAAFTDGMNSTLLKRENDGQPFVPHDKALAVLKQVVLKNDGNVSRGRDLAMLLGIRGDKKMMGDDRTLIVIQRLPNAMLAQPVLLARPSGTPVVSSIAPAGPQTTPANDAQSGWSWGSRIAVGAAILAVGGAAMTGAHFYAQQVTGSEKQDRANAPSDPNAAGRGMPAATHVAGPKPTLPARTTPLPTSAPAQPAPSTMTPGNSMPPANTITPPVSAPNPTLKPIHKPADVAAKLIKPVKPGSSATAPKPPRAPVKTTAQLNEDAAAAVEARRAAESNNGAAASGSAAPAPSTGGQAAAPTPAPAPNAQGSATPPSPAPGGGTTNQRPPTPPPTSTQNATPPNTAGPPSGSGSP